MMDRRQKQGTSSFRPDEILASGILTTADATTESGQITDMPGEEPGELYNFTHHHRGYMHSVLLRGVSARSTMESIHHSIGRNWLCLSTEAAEGSVVDLNLALAGSDPSAGLGISNAAALEIPSKSTLTPRRGRRGFKTQGEPPELNPYISPSALNNFQRSADDLHRECTSLVYWLFEIARSSMFNSAVRVQALGPDSIALTQMVSFIKVRYTTALHADAGPSDMGHYPPARDLSKCAIPCSSAGGIPCMSFHTFRRTGLREIPGVISPRNLFRRPRQIGIESKMLGMTCDDVLDGGRGSSTHHARARNTCSNMMCARKIHKGPIVGDVGRVWEAIARCDDNSLLGCHVRNGRIRERTQRHLNASVRTASLVPTTCGFTSEAESLYVFTLARIDGRWCSYMPGDNAICLAQVFTSDNAINMLGHTSTILDPSIGNASKG
ncbi:hypothetical protein ACP4OV_013271 [Aristida adscensionis]